MWRSELYATEVHEHLVTANYVLPVYTAPIAGEALLSWLVRLAAMAGQSPLAFARQAFGIDSARQPEWWRRPKADQRSKLLVISGLAPEQLDDMTLELLRGKQAERSATIKMRIGCWGVGGERRA